MNILEVIDLDKIGDIVKGVLPKTQQASQPTTVQVLQPLAPPLSKTQDFHTGHNGVDLGAGADKKVYAPEAGTVTVGFEAGGAGNYVTVDAGERVHKLFHLSKVTVKSGEQVKQGQPVGYVGSTGKSTGNHLHWEVWIGKQPVNPMQFVK